MTTNTTNTLAPKTPRVRATMPKTPEQLAAAKAAKEAAQAAASKHAWISSANAEFFAAAAKRAHKGKFTLEASSGGYVVKPTQEGIAFFSKRKANSTRVTGEQMAAIMAAKANTAGKFAERTFAANAAKIAGKPISLPSFQGAGDSLQQFLFAALVINAL